MTKEVSTHDILDQLYLLKKINLMAENLHGVLFIRKEFEKFKALHGIPKTESDLLEMINNFLTVIKETVPHDLKEEWDYSDYEVYTDKYYHRKFWNEIDNDDTINFFLDKFFKFVNVATDDSDDMKFTLRLYDFNDFDVYFHNEKEAVEFIDRYASAPITAFSKDEDGDWTEEWTI